MCVCGIFFFSFFCLRKSVKSRKCVKNCSSLIAVVVVVVLIKRLDEFFREMASEPVFKNREL